MNMNSSPLRIFLSICATAIMAPVAEEIFFRGYLFTALQSRYSIPIALVVTNLCFGIAHGDMYRFLPLAIGGLALNVWYLKERNLISAMVAHGTWNAIMSALFYLFQT